MLIVGGSATVNALTGMHTIAASKSTLRFCNLYCRRLMGNAVYLLPVGVVAYTMVGGLKATILTDWAHTFILLIILIIFSLTAYASHDVLGSPGAVYDLLVKAAARHPVEGNKDGSYLTMQSREGAIFFVINIVGKSCQSNSTSNQSLGVGGQA
jgi:Na+/proline symporter